jgi:hypothetical protein
VAATRCAGLYRDKYCYGNFQHLHIRQVSGKEALNRFVMALYFGMMLGDERGCRTSSTCTEHSERL